jgi:hypothetical protein
MDNFTVPDDLASFDEMFEFAEFQMVRASYAEAQLVRARREILRLQIQLADRYAAAEAMR